MAGDPRVRRRGRDVGLGGLLVEREHELSVIEQALADARDGAGTVVLIEAPAGKGKSRLLTMAGDLAREADMQVAGAHGSELEREFPFGVAVQLFEPRWTAADAAERALLLAGPARHAADLMRGELPPAGRSPEDQAYSIVHGLFWMSANLVSTDEGAGDPSSLAMLVDDVQWADRPSLRFLAYLAERIADLPIALLLTLRTGEDSADRTALAALRRMSAGRVLHPGSLSDQGVTLLVSTVFPEADAEFSGACASVTHGNPFLLIELLEELRRTGAAPDSATAARLSERAPESVMQAVAARLDALPLPARRVARAIAVLGTGAPLHLVAALAELPDHEAAQAADNLAAVYLVQPGSPLEFVHPLIGSAVRDAIPPLDRGALHRRAATLLAEEGAAEDQIVAHLLAAPPGEDPAALAALRAGARRALASGAAQSAVRMLERALAESPSRALQPELLAELAEAQSAAGMPHAIERLEHALSIAGSGELRARLALTQARAYYDACRYREAADVLAFALRQVDPEAEIVAALEAAFVAAAFFVPALQAEAAARARSLLARVGRPPRPPELDALAHLAIHGALRGESRADVTAVARAAWHEGELLGAESLDGLGWPLPGAALLFVDDLEFSLLICDAALAAAREEDSPAAYAAASYCRAWPLYEQGRVAEAAVDAQAGLDARPDGWRSYLRPACAAVALCHLQRGVLDQAETALSIIDQPDVRERIHIPSLLEARAQLRLAQHRPQDALADALRAGEELDITLQVINPGAVAWRSAAALAKLALGDPAGARDLAAAELDLAVRIDVPRLIVRNTRILGLAERGAAGLHLLAEAVARGEDCGPRLEHTQALLDYGAELRRSNQRAAARLPLRRALDLAHRGGALALADRAQVELAAAGARPRRIMLSGLDALTPSERRVAKLAAHGLTTRQIAEALFVTPKTVEFHLRHTYQKLEVNSRSQLSQLLARET